MSHNERGDHPSTGSSRFTSLYGPTSAVHYLSVLEQDIEGQIYFHLCFRYIVSQRCYLSNRLAKRHSLAVMYIIRILEVKLKYFLLSKSWIMVFVSAL